ncbi:GDPmannose 4,6-dehydratase [Nocardioides sp. J9]|uniref:GDP-mannose 4,6-dehydratase n=1 Tax=Nocardioides sp. J9 TaxID=935844 RepID=UPI0011A96C3D|nr:GDP-mannose 4,6-dehydratase [Nocardioides sp. J9]TWG93987.1 GDPmannose 4,6-dehydratase [Nocardioides sp. J9]
MTRTALVTGVTGQDGIYLARRLLADGMRVVGVVRPGSATGPRVDAYLDGVELREVDITDGPELRALVTDVAPQEVYNLAALSSVGRSWQEPELTRRVNHDAVVDLVAAAHDIAARGREVRFFQASSAEVVGQAADSPYARAKADAERVVEKARSEGLPASYARLYVHESPVRPLGFVFRKITRGAAEIALGRQDQLTLGTLDVRRDWGHAAEYVDAFVRMLRRDEPVDLPLGTGVDHSLADLVEVAFAAAGVDDPWSRIVQDPALVRPADSKVLRADPEPAAAAIGWRATTSFADLVTRMVEVDLERVRTGVEDDVSYL